MRSLLSIVLVPALICALAGEGRGQESKSWKENTWYGGQILVADGVSVLTLAIGGARGLPVFFVGAASFVIAPAVIHVIHDNYGRAALSALMRIGLPIGGALLAYELAKSHSSSPDSEYNRTGWGLAALLGFGLGMGMASTVDVCFARASPFLFSELPPPTPHELVSLTSAGIVPTPNGPRLMIGGRF
jgi:hypothetical protein